MVKRKNERKKRVQDSQDTKSGNKAIQPKSNKVYTKKRALFK